MTFCLFSCKPILFVTRSTLKGRHLLLLGAILILATQTSFQMGAKEFWQNYLPRKCIHFPLMTPLSMPRHTLVAEYHGTYVCIKLAVRVSICRMSVCPYFHFRMITWVNINGFGLPMGKFHQFLTELSARNSSGISFPDNNFRNMDGFSPNLLCALIL